MARTRKGGWPEQVVHYDQVGDGHFFEGCVSGDGLFTLSKGPVEPRSLEPTMHIIPFS